MATKKEIIKHLKIALKETGRIEPWFDKLYKNWVFSHPAYPVEYSGDTKEEVIKNYPSYLQDFIEERLNDNLSQVTEKKQLDVEAKEKGLEDLKGQKTNRKNVFLFR